MKKMMIAVLILAIALFVSCSNTPTGPEPVKKTYTLEITYIRVEVTYPNWLMSTPMAFLGAPSGSRIADIGFLKVDDYTFKGGAQQIAPGIYGLVADDLARGDCKTGTVLVGCRFLVKVKETGYEKEITSIVLFTMQGFDCATSKSTMAKLQVFENGTVDNAY